MEDQVFQIVNVTTTEGKFICSLTVRAKAPTDEDRQYLHDACAAGDCGYEYVMVADDKGESTAVTETFHDALLSLASPIVTACPALEDFVEQE